MEIIKQYVTPLGEMTLYDNGIQKEIWTEAHLTDLAQIKAHMARTNEQLQNMEQVFLLIDSSATRKLSKDVRDFASEYEADIIPSAIALLLNSVIAKMLGSLMLKFNKFKYPIKIFTDEQKAIDWLLSYKKS